MFFIFNRFFKPRPIAQLQERADQVERQLFQMQLAIDPDSAAHRVITKADEISAKLATIRSLVEVYEQGIMTDLRAFDNAPVEEVIKQ